MKQQLTHEEHSILTEIVQNFLCGQPGYDPNEKINIFYEDGRLCSQPLKTRLRFKGLKI